MHRPVQYSSPSISEENHVSVSLQTYGSCIGRRRARLWLWCFFVYRFTALAPHSSTHGKHKILMACWIWSSHLCSLLSAGTTRRRLGGTYNLLAVSLAFSPGLNVGQLLPDFKEFDLRRYYSCYCLFIFRPLKWKRQSLGTCISWDVCR
jgi:hypothetical protein